MAVNHREPDARRQRTAYAFAHAASLCNAGLALIATDVLFFCVVAESNQNMVRSILELGGRAWVPLVLILFLPVMARLLATHAARHRRALVLRLVVLIQMGIQMYYATHLPYAFVNLRAVLALSAVALFCGVGAEHSIRRWLSSGNDATG